MEKQRLVELVQRAQDGDSDALSDLFTAYKNEVYSIAMQQTGNRTLSEDIVQETFLEVILKISDLKQPAAFPSWLKILAYHQCTRYYKKKETMHEESAAENEDGFSVLDTLEETNAAFLPDAALDQAEFRATILAMINALPDAQKAALLMFYYEQMPLKVIAQVQEVSINTANTRLNRGRLAVKSSVEEYEKKHGIRLHTIAFLPFFKWLLQGTKQAMPETSAVLVAQGITEETGVNIRVTGSQAGSAPVKPVAAAAKTGAAAGLKAGSAGITAKVIAGATAISIAVGGAVAYQVKRDLPEKTTAAVVSPKETTSSEASIGEGRNSGSDISAPTDPAQEALACYEKFLAQGIAKNGFSISHYAYLDIDQDGVPELIAADNNGTSDTITTCELYTFQDKTMKYCGETGAYYDNLYYVNQEYLRGCNLLGAHFVSTDDSFQTAIYHWNDTGDRNDPAISRNSGEWEYITQDAFEYYNSLSGGFVTTSEIISLHINPYTASSQFLDSSKAWTTTKEYDGRNYAATWIFDSDGKYYFLLGEVLSEYYGFYCGSYCVLDDLLVLSMTKDGDRIACAYLWDGGTQLTQITQEGRFFCIKLGETFTLKEDEWNTAERLKELVLYSVAEDIDTVTILSGQGKYRNCPYYNKETGLTGFVGLDTADGTQFYFGCWVDSVSPSVEDFLFEYQEGITQYTVTGNRNPSAQYELTVDRQDAYVDVTVKRIADEYKIIPESKYRFYLTEET